MSKPATDDSFERARSVVLTTHGKEVGGSVMGQLMTDILAKEISSVRTESRERLERALDAARAGVVAPYYRKGGAKDAGQEWHEALIRVVEILEGLDE